MYTPVSDSNAVWSSLSPVAAQIETFEVLGTKIGFCCTTCSFFEIDDDTALVLDTIRAGSTYEEARAVFNRSDSQTPLEEVIEEIASLAEAEYVCGDDPLLGHQPSANPGLCSLCLILATDCNLRCRYCYAEDGSYRQPRQIMNISTASACVDFLMRKSRRAKEVAIGFFGGEPMLNFQCIAALVPYAENAAKRCGKHCSFSITTNGTLLTIETVRFFEDHEFGYIVSLDGPRDINDKNRVFLGGQGSYDLVVRRLRQISAALPAFAEKVTIRATFTGRDHSLAESLSHLRDLGFVKVSLEPCSALSTLGGIDKEDLPGLLADYDRAARWYLELLRKGDSFSFFHMHQMLSQVAKGEKRITQCGAGRGYLAVAPDGTLYPCHRLVGRPSLAMGSVFGDISPEIQSLFSHASVPYKKPCRSCWARYLCGGGCHATALQFNSALLEPYQTDCEIMKHRIKLGAWIYAQLAGSVPREKISELPCASICQEKDPKIERRAGCGLQEQATPPVGRHEKKHPESQVPDSNEVGPQYGELPIL